MSLLENDLEAGLGVGQDDTVALTPTIWGLTPLELHDRFWASRGVPVVRQGGTPPPEKADVYLLIGRTQMVVFEAAGLREQFYWDRQVALFLRVTATASNSHVPGNVVSDENGAFLHYLRPSSGPSVKHARVLLTNVCEVAEQWHRSGLDRSVLRPHITRRQRGNVTESGAWGDARRPTDAVRMLHAIMKRWDRPASVIDGVRLQGNAWVDNESTLPKSCTCVGPVWVGAGRKVQVESVVAGPAILWDAPDAGRVAALMPEGFSDFAIAGRAQQKRRRSTVYQRTKRAFDIAFALGALAVTLPFYPLIILAIWIEDGLPAFFAQERETRHHRLFLCWKFRSMYREADRIKLELLEMNEADGPQFFLAADPRVTKVGRFLRKFHIDEWPQFWNVLRGEMSIVGPRPSPRHENRFCPPWSEARLTVPAGMTGLWQVRRTRTPGHDFREWIEFDLDYIEGRRLASGLTNHLQHGAAAGKE